VRCVAVTTGGIAREVLAQAGAAEVYESVAEVLAALDQVLDWESRA
jgi:phosphoglycolate phosphatase-like HAD superfamily hydrolase